MCGFVGGMLQKSLEDRRLDRALAALHHRGPDAIRLKDRLPRALGDEDF